MSLSGKKILVTGASGFIGKHLVESLSNEGASRIVALSRRPSDIVGVESISLDLVDRESVKAFAASGDFDVIYNLAGRIDQGTAAGIYEEQLKSNTLTAIYLADAFDGRVGRFIQVGSNAEYGDAPCPQAPDGVTRPCSAYGISKLAASEAILAKARSSAFPGLIARPYLVYGEGQGKNAFLTKLIMAAAQGENFPTTEGNQTRDFTPIQKVIDELILLGSDTVKTKSVYNLCTGIPIRLRDILSMISELNPRFTPQFGAIPYRSTELMSSSGVAWHPWGSSQAQAHIRIFFEQRLRS